MNTKSSSQIHILLQKRPLVKSWWCCSQQGPSLQLRCVSAVSVFSQEFLNKVQIKKETVIKPEDKALRSPILNVSMLVLLNYDPVRKCWCFLTTIVDLGSDLGAATPSLCWASLLFLANKWSRRRDFHQCPHTISSLSVYNQLSPC